MKDLYRRSALSASGETVIRISGTSFSETYSMTLMTRYGAENDHIVIQLREESNTQWDFFKYIRYMCII